jgi:hypothetical protein
MSNGIDVEFVKERYAGMSDQELSYFITHEGGGITPEALDLAKAEIEKRGLSSQLVDALDVQNKTTYTVEEIDDYCDIIRSLDCPVCYKRNEKLNAVKTAEVMSFLVLTQYTKEVRIGCEDCLDKGINKSLGKTILLGWWGVPWGIIRTIEAISINLKSKHINRMQQEIPSDLLRGFAIANMGRIEANKGNRAGLQQIIARNKE